MSRISSSCHPPNTCSSRLPATQSICCSDSEAHPTSLHAFRWPKIHPSSPLSRSIPLPSTARRRSHIPFSPQSSTLAAKSLQTTKHCISHQATALLRLSSLALHCTSCSRHLSCAGRRSRNSKSRPQKCFRTLAISAHLSGGCACLSSRYRQISAPSAPSNDAAAASTICPPTPFSQRPKRDDSDASPVLWVSESFWQQLQSICLFSKHFFLIKHFHRILLVFDSSQIHSKGGSSSQHSPFIHNHVMHPGPWCW